MTIVKGGPFSQNTVPPEDAIPYLDTRGQTVADSDFTKTGVEADIAAASDTALSVLQDRFIYGAERKMPIAAGMLTTSNRAYWQYLGYFPIALTGKTVDVRVWSVTAGVGTSTAEVALATSPAAPNRSSQVLTKLNAAAISTDLAAVTGVVGGQMTDVDIAAGTHLWAGIRTAMATTQPTLLAVANDMGQGEVLSTNAVGALTGAGPWTGATITAALTAQAPLITATITEPS